MSNSNVFFKKIVGSSQKTCLFVPEIQKNSVFVVCLSLSEKRPFCLSFVHEFSDQNLMDMSFCP